ncbi:ABC transporter substrate-binding protein [Roseicyclus mahoneyensis]|uniref:Iron(III) transport system substrate-binding protein n=1 Tax=Roseicyclus mahoneyensis TaxID=164332 RepID=A0A316GWZ6_9RHOB|nr:ABC transporter substrate-binding protein [Roseicyclus mahoneyensis]PWK59599.1 iron(III) transport system substrate-binding protein [Roseicyclus mahoneyensis]
MLKTTLRASVATVSLLAATSAFADVTVYTAGPAGLIEQLAAGFTEETGIAIEFFQATTGNIMARIEAEAANPVVDVLISASWDTATDFAERGWLAPYTSPNAATVPDFLQTDTAVAQGVAALAIAWNPTSGTPRPTEWSDLTAPEFQGLVNLPDPAQSGSAFELVAALMATSGIELFDSLAANGAIVAGANAEALNPVLQGAKAAVFGAVDYIALNNMAAGESIEVIFPESGTVIAPRPMMILNWSDNQTDAQAFIDYVLSDAGQAIVAAQNLMPARADVAADRALIADLTILPIDAEAVYGARAETLDAFAGAFAQ